MDKTGWSVPPRKHNLDQWLTEVPFSDEQRQGVDETLMAMLPNREFEIDVSYARKLVQK